MKKVLFGITIFVVTVAFGLFSLEMVSNYLIYNTCRFAPENYIPSDYPDIVYENNPGWVFTSSIMINSYGFNDDLYITVEKPEKTFRILGLGDSFMFGWNVYDAEKNFMSLLENKLKNRNPVKYPDIQRYQTINAASPGYTTIQEVALLKHKLMKFKPDLLIIQFCGNDIPKKGSNTFLPILIPIDSFLGKLSTSNLIMRSLDNVFGYKSAFTKWVKGNIFGVFYNDLKTFRTPGLQWVFETDKDNNYIAGRNGEIPEKYKDFSRLTFREAFLEPMKELVEIANSMNIKVMNVGDFGDRYPKILKLNNELGVITVDYRSYWNQYIKRHNVVEKKALWYKENDSHPNEVGHDLIAEAIYAKIVEHKLTPLGKQKINKKTGRYYPPTYVFSPFTGERLESKL